MGSLVVLGWFALILVCFWIGHTIREYIDNRRYWKWVESHFKEKQRIHNERVLNAFEKTLESEPFKEYLIKVFKEAKEKKENENKNQNS